MPAAQVGGSFWSSQQLYWCFTFSLAWSSFLERKQNQVCAKCFWLPKGFGVQLEPLIKLLIKDYLRSFYFLVLAKDWGQEEIAAFFFSFCFWKISKQIHTVLFAADFFVLILIPRSWIVRIWVFTKRRKKPPIAALPAEKSQNSCSLRNGGKIPMIVFISHIFKILCNILHRGWLNYGFAILLVELEMETWVH